MTDTRTAQGGQAGPTGPEVVLFEGHPLHGAYFGTYLFLGLLSLVLVGLPFLLWRILQTRAERYRITSRRIQKQTGVLSHHVESLELWRVRDVGYEASLWERMLGFGRILVDSTDLSSPRLVLRGLPESKTLFQTLLDATEESRRKGRTATLVE